MSELLEILVAAVPFAAIGGLLSIAGRAQRRRARSIHRQIALTDAIHRELGAVAAPVVALGPGGVWVVRMAAPLDQAATVASLARITHELFSRLDGPLGPGVQLVVDHREVAPRRSRAATGAPRVGREVAGRLRAA